ncbi:MAG: flavodoxin family protein [Sporomusaceae bacterium]|nr:flavodoxin family protein [Sporomusaceae bacterium]
MKVLGINGSARRNGNTAILLNKVFAELQQAGIETEMLQLGGEGIQGCMACYGCVNSRDQKCVITEDIVNISLQKMMAADGIILGSPTYFADVTSDMKAFIDRVGFVSRANGGLLKHKAGAAVVAVRRGGALHAFDTMQHFLHISEMFLVGANYWNFAYGRDIGEVEQDQEAMENMKVLGRNMAYLMQKLAK